MSRPFIPVPNVAQVELIYSVEGQIVENVINVHKGSPYSFSDLQAVRTIVNSWDAVSWAGARGQAATLVRIRSRARDSNSAPMEDYILPTPRPGSIAQVLLPNNCSVAFKLSTGRQGRSYRGRWFWVGMVVGHLNVSDSNKVSSTTAAAVVALLNTLITNLASGGHTLGVVSLRQNKVWLTTGDFTPATGYVVVDYNMDSMRRRLTGRGA